MSNRNSRAIAPMVCVVCANTIAVGELVCRNAHARCYQAARRRGLLDSLPPMRQPGAAKGWPKGRPRPQRPKVSSPCRCGCGRTAESNRRGLAKVCYERAKRGGVLERVAAPSRRAQ